MIQYRCIDHSMHHAAYYFIKTLSISSLTKTKHKSDTAADDIEAMASTTSVTFEPRDILGKLLAFVNQVCMLSEGVWDYLIHACVVHQLKPMELCLWVWIW